MKKSKCGASNPSMKKPTMSKGGMAHKKATKPTKYAAGSSYKG